MTTAFRDLLPVAMTCLVFFRGSSSLPTEALTHADLMPPRDIRSVSTEDYDILDEPTTTTRAPRVSTEKPQLPHCLYSPCLENQASCLDLSASTGCSCPGFASPQELPEAPRLKSLSWNGSEVIIQWCAPYSYVTAYTVTVGGESRRTFGGHQRSGALGNIDHIAQVCVLAQNGVGLSQEACGMYRPRDDSLALKAGLVGGALGLLLLLLGGLLLWRHKRQKKQEASVSARGSEM